MNASGAEARDLLKGLGGSEEPLFHAEAYICDFFPQPLKSVPLPKSARRRVFSAGC
jgi:hypothetical protein